MNSDITTLITKLRSSNPVEQQAAAQQLASLQEQAQPAAVPLVEACTSAGDVHEWVVAALESLGPPATSDIGPLSQLLRAANLDTAYWAATLLGRLQASAAPAVQELAAALANHPETAVRERAAWAL